MLSMNVFDSNAFGLVELTKAINQPTEGQAAPDMLDTLFQEEGVTSPAVFIERAYDALALVPAAERGGPSAITTRDRPDVIPFTTLHLPTRGTVRADEVLGLRAFGTTEQETLLNLVNQHLGKMRRRLEATLRFHRIKAVTGKILDADGTRVLLDIHSAFGITEQHVDMALGTDTTDVLQKVVDAKRKAEDAIGDTGAITGWLCVHGRGFGDAFRGHKDVKESYKDWQSGAMLRSDMRANFPYGGVEFREYYGRIGGIDFLGSDDAYLIPLGVEDLFITRFAPADYEETVGSLGIPYYARQEALPMGKGRALEAQTNPLNLCTKPRAIVRLYKLAKA
jgi:hypothetical protein